MRKNIIAAIFKKEMTDILRDKKTLFMMIILPIIMYPVLILLFSQIMMMSMSCMEQKELMIAFSTKPDHILLDKLENEKKDVGRLKIIEVNDYKKALENREIAAYVKVINSNSAVQYKIYINSSVDDSSTAVNRLERALEEYRRELVEKNVKAAGLNIKEVLEPITYETINIAKDEEMAGYLLGQILPFILIIGVLLGAIYPAIDVMAGEKERGTLETLLTMPISNLELIMGKYLAVSVSAVVTALLNILSIILTLIFVVLGTAVSDELGMVKINAAELIFPLLITLICICMFAMVVAAISMCVCSLAKNFKEAQNYITPIMFGVMIPSYASMIPNVELNGFTAVLPVVNISLLIKSVLTFRYDMVAIAVVLVTNMAFVLLSVLLLSKMFNSEEILFGNGKSFSFLEKRSNIKSGTLPSVSDGVILYAFGLLLLIYVGGVLQVSLKLLGIALTQLVIICLPLVFAYYIKTDFKKVFSLKLPALHHVLGGISLWAGGAVFSLLIGQFILYLFPQNIKVVEALSEALFSESNLFLSLIVVAVLPAICEEVFYRGFLVTAFKGKESNKRAIILSSILFGLMHIDFIRVIPTAILGLTLAYAVCKTGSIIIPMMMHFLNNGFTVITSYYPRSPLGKIYSLIEMDFSHLDLIKLFILISTSILLVFAGMLVLKQKKEVFY
ncbi:MAG: ABC-type transport system, permease [Clostridia bacterium]|jgi:sodium transport system permease protein|nr:ABC-type transport system, permease [Clostridia bacterium]